MRKKYYDVEKIVDKKRLPSGKVLYNVQWVGYSPMENTWETLANLANVKSMVEEFERTHANNDDIAKWKNGSIEDDVPKYIVGTKIVDGKLYMIIRWKKRRSNVQPENSMILYSELKERYPYVVLEFFETNLNLDSKHLEFIPDKNEFTLKESNEN